MAHISELALFDYVARKADLSTEENEHLQECDDCRDEVIGLRRVVQDSADIEKTRRFLAEQGDLPLASEPPKEIHEEQRELDETPGS
jgi:predicted anti-sigma-YlaC factor YlaD